MDDQLAAFLERLTPAECHFLAAVHRRALNLDAFSRGLFAESLVCINNLDGATLAPLSYQEWDIKWTVDGREITIAVCTTGARGEAYLESDADYKGKWEFRARGAFDPVERQWRKKPDSTQDETSDAGPTSRYWPFIEGIDSPKIGSSTS